MEIENIVDRRRKGHFRVFGTEYNIRESLTAMGFMLPAVCLAIVFIFLPMVISLAFAFTDANMMTIANFNWVGFDTIARVFSDPRVAEALRNTLYFVAGVMPLQFFAALGLALILKHVSHGNKFLRWAFFCPVMLSLAVTSMLWMNLLNRQDGLINTLLLAIGASPVAFLENPSTAMPCIIFISAWQGAGYQMLILLSALQNIPKEQYEAAEIDKASKWQQFLNVTLPGIKPTMVFVFITMLIGAFRICVQPMLMTPGGLNGATMTMSYFIYNQAQEYGNFGYSSAVALVYTFLIATVSLLLRKVLGGDNQE